MKAQTAPQDGDNLELARISAWLDEAHTKAFQDKCAQAHREGMDWDEAEKQAYGQMTLGEIYEDIESLLTNWGHTKTFAQKYWDSGVWKQDIFCEDTTLVGESEEGAYALMSEDEICDDLRSLLLHDGHTKVFVENFIPLRRWKDLLLSDKWFPVQMKDACSSIGEYSQCANAAYAKMARQEIVDDICSVGKKHAGARQDMVFDERIVDDESLNDDPCKCLASVMKRLSTSA